MIDAFWISLPLAGAWLIRIVRCRHGCAKNNARLIGELL